MNIFLSFDVFQKLIPNFRGFWGKVQIVLFLFLPLVPPCPSSVLLPEQAIQQASLGWSLVTVFFGVGGEVTFLSSLSCMGESPCLTSEILKPTCLPPSRPSQPSSLSQWPAAQGRMFFQPFDQFRCMLLHSAQMSFLLCTGSLNQMALPLWRVLPSSWGVPCALVASRQGQGWRSIPLGDPRV